LGELSCFLKATLKTGRLTTCITQIEQNAPFLSIQVLKAFFKKNISQDDVVIIFTIGRESQKLSKNGEESIHENKLA